MYAGDKPIIAKDLDGEEEYVVIKAATSQNGRVRISVVYVPEAYRRADPHGGGAYNGIDYYIGNDKNVDNVNNRTMTPTFSSDVGFLNPQEAQKANEQTSYQTNTGRFSGTGSSLSSISTGGSHVGAKKSGDLKSSEGNYIYNTNHQVTNSYQTGAIGDVPVSNANFYFPTDISNNLAANTAPEAGLNVSAIVQNLISDPNANLNITGFASKSGNIDHNMELSKDRAKYVKQLVVNEAQRQGVTDINAFSRRITTNAVGSTTATGDQNADISTDRKVTATIQSGNQ